MLFAEVDFGLSAIIMMVLIGVFTMKATKFMKSNPDVSSVAGNGIVDVISRLMK